MKNKKLPPTQPAIRLLPDGRQAQLLEALDLEDAQGHRHHVPAGFVTDFASVPRFFWRLVPPWGRYGPAAIVHDYAYRIGLGTRREADKAFRLLMAKLDVPWWLRWPMYLAVRLFGHFAWQG